MRRTAMAVVVGVLLLTALARAELAEIHWRREEVERERDQLRRELEALRAARESPPTPTPGPEEAAAPRSATPGPQERISRPWWRRVIGTR